MRREDVVIGEHYAYGRYGGSLGGYGMIKVIAVSKDATDTFKTHGWEHKTQRGIRIRLVNPDDWCWSGAPPLVAPTRNLVGTWEQHQAVLKAREDRNTSVKLAHEARRARALAINAALEVKGLKGVDISNYNQSTRASLPYETLEALLGIEVPE